MHQRGVSRILMLLENNSFRDDIRPQREARTLRAAGYRVSCICPLAPGGKVLDEWEGVRLYQYPLPQGASGLTGYVLEYGFATGATFVLSLVALLREGFDVVHAHNPPDTFFPIGAWYKLLGKRFVFDHHDLAPEMYAHARFSDGGSKLVHRALIVLEQLTCRVADHIVTANDSHKALVMQRGNVQERRITVVRNGPDIDSTRPIAPDPELRQRAGTILAYVGRIAPQDGLDYLVRAMHHLVYDLGYTDVLCVVMGDGDMMGELQALAQDLCVSDHIWFTGWISDKYLLRRYLATANICVDPDPANPYNDRSTMIKMMEYMAAGKPIVAFDLLESRRSADTAAVYVPNNDELEFARQVAALIDDPQRREAMGRAGHERIRRELGWPHQGQRLLEAYATLEPA